MGPWPRLKAKHADTVRIRQSPRTGFWKTKVQKPVPNPWTGGGTDSAPKPKPKIPQSPNPATQQHENAMGYTLIQLRPHPTLLRTTTAADIPEVVPEKRCGGLRRWLCFYLPTLLIIFFVLYLAVELLLKRCALTSFQQEMERLPDVPTMLPPPAAAPPPSENGSLAGGSYF